MVGQDPQHQQHPQQPITIPSTRLLSPANRLEFDYAYPDSTGWFSPKDLMSMWRAIGKQAPWLPQIHFDNRTPWAHPCWPHFARLRRWLIDNGVHPIPYFRALACRSERGREHGRPFNILYSALGGEMYARIYKEWFDNVLKANGTDITNERIWAQEFRYKRLTAEAKVKFHVRKSFEEYLCYWRLNPNTERQTVVEHLAQYWGGGDFSAYFLFFLPEAQPLVERWAPRTGNQRDVFARLRSVARVRDKYRDVYDRMTSADVAKRWMAARDAHLKNLDASKARLEGMTRDSVKDVRLDLVEEMTPELQPDSRIRVEGGQITVAPRRVRQRKKFSLALDMLKQRASTTRDDYLQACHDQRISSRMADDVVKHAVEKLGLKNEHVGHKRIYRW